MWSVIKGDSRVIIMGYVAPVPEKLDWKQGRIVHALQGAKVLLVPPEPKVNIGNVFGLLRNFHSFILPSNTTLRDVLSAEDYAALQALASTTESSPFLVDRLKPSAAAAVLLAIQMQTLHLSTDEPVSTVKQLAKREHVPVREMSAIEVGTLVRVGKTMTEDQQISCFKSIMAEATWEAKASAAAADEWANGDISGLRKHRSAISKGSCLGRDAIMESLDEKMTADAVNAILDALSQPGKTVALFDIDLLDEPNGILDRLRNAGADIRVPE